MKRDPTQTVRRDAAFLLRLLPAPPGQRHATVDELGLDQLVLDPAAPREAEHLARGLVAAVGDQHVSQIVAQPQARGSPFLLIRTRAKLLSISVSSQRSASASVPGVASPAPHSRRLCLVVYSCKSRGAANISAPGLLARLLLTHLTL